MTSRRWFLRMGSWAVASFTSVACSHTFKGSNKAPNQDSARGSIQPPSLSPTPACGTEGPTLPQTAGPFYTPESPERTSLLEPGITGTPIILTGQVLSPSCEPIANALLDFWHTDDEGQYDNSGYRLRGHQFTDAQGRYRLETIVPGIYPGRTRHFHVRVRAENMLPLTTQLYFPEEALNARDGLFQPELLVTLNSSHAAKQTEQQAVFNFVLAAVS